MINIGNLQLYDVETTNVLIMLSGIEELLDKVVKLEDGFEMNKEKTMKTIEYIRKYIVKKGKKDE